MKRWMSLLAAFAVACTLVTVAGPEPAGAAQTCPGAGNGNVGGLPMEQQISADLNGNDKPDRVQTFEDTATGAAMTRVILDNGYRDVFDHGFVGFGIEFERARDVDRDNDAELFIRKLHSASFMEIEMLVFADCQLVVPLSAGGTPVDMTVGGFPNTWGLDCFAPTQGGKGITTYVNTLDLANGQYNSVRREYRLTVNENAGTATLTRKHQSTISYGDGTAVANWRSDFKCPALQRCGGMLVTIQGTPARDLVQGTAGRDIVTSLAGNDTIHGKGGADVICGGDGRDVANGNGGNDRIFGQGGVDSLNGHLGADTLNGGLGNDRLNGGPGKDTAIGGPGNDACTAETKKTC